MDTISSGWAVRAAQRVEARLAARPHWWTPWDRGIVLTARTDYRERPLSSDFAVEVMDAAGTPRRVAVAKSEEGSGGRALMILPGLYAGLNQGLFALIAELAARHGRHVLLVEDRLATGTLALTGGEIPSLGRIGEEIAAIARRLPEPPDVLALSVGAAAALAAPLGAFARIATWSGALDLWVTAEHVVKNPMLYWYYSRVHKRAFLGAHLAVPPLATIPAHLAAGVPCGLVPGPLLVLHAEDDPVVPASSVRDLEVEDGQCVKVLLAGAHLGFGTLAGANIYLVPFDEEFG